MTRLLGGRSHQKEPGSDESTTKFTVQEPLAAFGVNHVHEVGGKNKV